MKLQILYDNNAQNNYKVGWGFSCLIEASENKILFDTGWNGYILLHNMKIAGVNPEEIDIIVISHAHWDHIGGLNHILNYGKKPNLFISESISNNLKIEIKRQANVMEISKAQKICEDVWTTGELGEKIKEQSLIVSTENGNVIITGCAHPGLDDILKKSRDWGNVYAVIGGFHDSITDSLSEISLIMPCHCTKGIEKIRKDSYESFRECYVGSELEF
jgi:7,8-dihydropterin-6-yl-methyl-4-(beta-D-ribofuranosyl)aminobenzene 5'-phosphate synthase